MFFSCWHCQEIAMPCWKKRHVHDFCIVYYVLLFSKWDILVRHYPSAFFFKSTMKFFLTQSECCITYIHVYLVNACSCTCVCTWERVWYFCYPCPKSDSSSGCTSWTGDTQIVTTPNSTIYFSIFAMLIALEKMQIWWIHVKAGLYFCFWKQSRCATFNSTIGYHLHVQVTIWWGFFVLENGYGLLVQVLYTWVQTDKNLYIYKCHMNVKKIIFCRWNTRVFNQYFTIYDDVSFYRKLHIKTFYL